MWISLPCLWCFPFGITNYNPAQRSAHTGIFLSSSFWSPTPSFPCRALTCTPTQNCTAQTSWDRSPYQNEASKMWEAMRAGMESMATVMCRSSTLHCPPHLPTPHGRELSSCLLVDQEQLKLCNSSGKGWMGNKRMGLGSIGHLQRHARCLQRWLNKRSWWIQIRGRLLLEVQVAIKNSSTGLKGGTLWTKWAIKHSAALSQVKRSAWEHSDGVGSFFSFETAAPNTKSQEFVTWSLEVLQLVVVAQCLWRHHLPVRSRHSVRLCQLSADAEQFAGSWMQPWGLIHPWVTAGMSHCYPTMLLAQEQWQCQGGLFWKRPGFWQQSENWGSFMRKTVTQKNPKCLGQIPVWCRLDGSQCWFSALHHAKEGIYWCQGESWDGCSPCSILPPPHRWIPCWPCNHGMAGQGGGYFRRPPQWPVPASAEVYPAHWEMGQESCTCSANFKVQSFRGDSFPVWSVTPPLETYALFLLLGIP